MPKIRAVMPTIVSGGTLIRSFGDDFSVIVIRVTCGTRVIFFISSEIHPQLQIDEVQGSTSADLQEGIVHLDN
jgi:hypothetical protein